MPQYAETNTLQTESRGIAIAWIVAILSSGLLLYWTGRFGFRLEPDSESYLRHDLSSLRGALSGIRTPGYPLLLSLVNLLTGIERVPVVHWLGQVTAAVVFMIGLVQAGVSIRSATVCSLPLLFSRSLWDFGAMVASDSVAVSIAIISTGFFLMTCRENAKARVFVALALLTFSTILIRPAFLFLLVLWPTLGPWLWFFLYRRSFRSAFRGFALYCALALIPSITYSAIRYSVVDEFGIVSFAGYNLIGVSGQFLEPSDLDKLPEKHRELARRMIDNRVNIDDYAPPESLETMVFLFNATVWKTAAPAAESLYGGDTSACNRNLKELAMELIGLHSDRYRRWLTANSQRAVDHVLRLSAADVGFRFAVLLATGWYIARFVVSRFRRSKAEKGMEVSTTLSANGNAKFELSLMFWVAMVFCLGKSMLVILVEPANDRYMCAAMCLVPSFLSLAAYFILQSMSAFFDSSPSFLDSESNDSVN